MNYYVKKIGKTILFMDFRSLNWWKQPNFVMLTK
jgi:hypothetical protein